MSEGESKTLRSSKGEDVVMIEPMPVCVMGSRPPLPTTICEEEVEGRRECKLPGLENMWDEAPVSRNTSDRLLLDDDGGAMEACRAAWSCPMSQGCGGGMEDEPAPAEPGPLNSGALARAGAGL
jgi:hypothetical protein